jgi:hypothetical protein
VKKGESYIRSITVLKKNIKMDFNSVECGSPYSGSGVAEVTRSCRHD